MLSVCFWVFSSSSLLLFCCGSSSHEFSTLAKDCMHGTAARIFISKSLIAIDAFNCCHCCSPARSIIRFFDFILVICSLEVRCCCYALGSFESSSVCMQTHASEYFPFFSISAIFGNFGIQKNFDYIRCTAYNTHTHHVNVNFGIIYQMAIQAEQAFNGFSYVLVHI